MSSKPSRYFLLAIASTLFLVTACQPKNNSMDPAAMKAEVKKQFEAKGMAVIDSMTAICSKRTADATK